MNHRFSFHWAIVTLASMFLAACAAPQGLPAGTATPAPATPTAAPAALPTLAASYEGWQQYRDRLHGFALLYPPGWTAELDLREQSTSREHLLWLRPPTKSGEIAFSVGFKRVGEAYGIQRTGVGAGEFVVRGSVPFLGESVIRWMLVAEGKDMGLLYDQSAEIRRGNTVFTLGLDYAGRPTDPVTLPEDVEQQADMIVASFKLAE
jgi:hypothetical protein